MWPVLVATAGLLLATFVLAALLPRGDVLAFESDRAGSWDIYLFDERMRRMVNISRLPGDENTQSWSPDSQRLAVVVDDGGRKSIAVVDAATGESRRLMGGDANYQNPAWQP